MEKVYLDYAATTPVDPKVAKTILSCFVNNFGNPASLHSFGQKAKKELDLSREKMLHFLNADSGCVVFTSSATESNNLVIKGVSLANRERGNHVIVSSIEHDCVLESVNWLKKQGFRISYLPVNKYGLVDPKKVAKEIGDKTILVSVMHANNEIGTIEPITEIGEVCKKHSVYFHMDAAQTFTKMPIDVEKAKIDLLTASSHKIYGPKGTALLYLSDSVKIDPIIHGGGQELGLRSSTVNLAGIKGFTKAAEIGYQQMVKESKRIVKFRDEIIKTVLGKVSHSYLNGHPTKRLANNINFRFDFVEGESIVLALDQYGIAVSTGSACSSPKLEPSHVLLAIGLKPQQAHGSLRVTLGRFTTQEEVEHFLKVLPRVIEDLRKTSPFKANNINDKS